MDNREFNVKGRTKEQLALAIKCLLLDEYGKLRTPSAWYVDEKKGFIITFYKKEHSIEFTDRLGKPSPITETELVDILWEWLHKLTKSEISKFTNSGKWDHDMDDDVTTNPGWRLYTEDWGHIQNTKDGGTDHSSIGALIPSFCWYGK